MIRFSCEQQETFRTSMALKERDFFPLSHKRSIEWISQGRVGVQGEGIKAPPLVWLHHTWLLFLALLHGPRRLLGFQPFIATLQTAGRQQYGKTGKGEQAGTCQRSCKDVCEKVTCIMSAFIFFIFYFFSKIILTWPQLVQGESLEMCAQKKCTQLKSGALLSWKQREWILGDS